jgi:septum site-determining protein MinD
MSRTIAVIGGKGGVGKTMISSNLTYALTNLGEDVIAIDSNLTTPNLGLHFGMHLTDKTLHDVLRGDARLKSATYPHPYGFKFIPASISVNALEGTDVRKLSNLTFRLTGKADYILIDSAAGLGREAVSAIEAADEILLVTNPDLPSIADALKTADIARRMDKSIIGVVVNRKKGKRHELDIDDIRNILELPVIAQIPEDRAVSESIAAKQPLIEYAPDSNAAIEINRLAHKITGRAFRYKKPVNIRILDSLVGWMSR